MKKEKMVSSLQKVFVPALRERGFRGSLPHFRRPTKNRIDLLTIQFDKWGGGFAIEISNYAPDGIVMPWGEQIPPNECEHGMSTLLTDQGWDLRSRERMAIGSDSTDGQGLIKLPNKLFRILQRLIGGG